MGTNVFSKFKSVTINYGGSNPKITIACQKVATDNLHFGFIDVEPFAIIVLEPNATPIRCHQESDPERIMNLFAKKLPIA